MSLYLDKEWKIESLEELHDRDQEHWKNLHVYLHEGTLDYVLRKLEALLPQLVKKALQSSQIPRLLTREAGTPFSICSVAAENLSGQLGILSKRSAHREFGYLARCLTLAVHILVALSGHTWRDKANRRMIMKPRSFTVCQ